MGGIRPDGIGGGRPPDWGKKPPETTSPQEGAGKAPSPKKSEEAAAPDEPGVVFSPSPKLHLIRTLNEQYEAHPDQIVDLVAEFLRNALSDAALHSYVALLHEDLRREIEKQRKK